MAMGASKTTGKQSLSDLSSDCLMLIVQLRSAKNIDDPAQLRERTKAVLDRLDRAAKDAGFEREDIENAKFALVAFIDGFQAQAPGESQHVIAGRVFLFRSAGNGRESREVLPDGLGFEKF